MVAAGKLPGPARGRAASPRRRTPPAGLLAVALHLGRAVRAGGAGARRRPRTRRRDFTRASPATSCRTRSRRPTSTCSPLDPLGGDRRRPVVVEDSPQRPASRRAAAGIACVGHGQRLHRATRTSAGAAFVVDSLGEPGADRVTVLANDKPARHPAPLRPHWPTSTAVFVEEGRAMTDKPTSPPAVEFVRAHDRGDRRRERAVLRRPRRGRRRRRLRLFARPRLRDSSSAAWDSFDRTDAAAFLQQDRASIIPSRIGGTSGPLWGTAFLRAAGRRHRKVRNWTVRRWSRCCARPPRASRRAATPDLGDKTLLDALVPTDRRDRSARSASAATGRPAVAGRRDGRPRDAPTRAPPSCRPGAAGPAYTGERSSRQRRPGRACACRRGEHWNKPWPTTVARRASCKENRHEEVRQRPEAVSSPEMLDGHRAGQPGHAALRARVQPDHAGRRPERRQGLDHPGLRLGPRARPRDERRHGHARRRLPRRRVLRHRRWTTSTRPASCSTSPKGVLHLVNNYTGDRMAFDMGQELAEAEGVEIERLSWSTTTSRCRTPRTPSGGAVSRATSSCIEGRRGGRRAGRRPRRAGAIGEQGQLGHPHDGHGAHRRARRPRRARRCSTWATTRWRWASASTASRPPPREAARRQRRSSTSCSRRWWPTCRYETPVTTSR